MGPWPFSAACCARTRRRPALFLFLGYYPIIKGPLDRISPALLRALAKLALFLVACALMYTALLFVLSLEQVAETFRQEAPGCWQ